MGGGGGTSGYEVFTVSSALTGGGSGGGSGGRVRGKVRGRGRGRVLVAQSYCTA